MLRSCNPTGRAWPNRHLQTGAGYEFEIKKIGKLNPKKLMMLIQHPDNAVKLATGLAILSIFISFVGAVSVDRIWAFLEMLVCW